LKSQIGPRKLFFSQFFFIKKSLICLSDSDVGAYPKESPLASQKRARWLRKTGPGEPTREPPSNSRLSIIRTFTWLFRQLVPVSPCTRRTKYSACPKLKNKARDMICKADAFIAPKNAVKSKNFHEKHLSPRKILSRFNPVSMFR
jgi:hypothetical protein